MLTLEHFRGTEDIERLTQWVESAEVNALWARDRFDFPLQTEQLEAHLEKMQQQQAYVFRVKDTGSGDIVGHAEIDQIRGHEAATISRILIAKAYRGKGYGKQMMELLIGFIKEELNIRNIYLYVFTRNKTAISLYKSLGFREVSLQSNYLTFAGESWSRLKMKWEQQANKGFVYKIEN